MNNVVLIIAVAIAVAALGLGIYALRRALVEADTAGAGGAGAKSRPLSEDPQVVPPTIDDYEEESEEEITLITVRLDIPDETDEQEPVDEDDGPRPGNAIQIIADPGAADDEPTGPAPLLLFAAAGQTDRGQRRKRNEDRFAVLLDNHVFVVADGMGGYAGGAVAAQLAVDTIASAFERGRFEGKIEAALPSRARELALAIQMANRAIWQQAQNDPDLQGMGTTLVGARFAPRKERVYIGHVGDSRCYRMRHGELRQLTTDHTMENLGMGGRFAKLLSRAVGVGSEVDIDVVIAKPEPNDVYLLCSDGLFKMVGDQAICDVLLGTPDLSVAVETLIEMANASGGRDNVTIVLIAVKEPSVLAELGPSADPTEQDDIPTELGTEV